MSAPLDGYNIGYLDEQTKRMIRRALLKAVAIPGFQVPFASREVPMPRGWGTGGVQVTASIIGQDDVLKVIDQGADDTTNAVSIRSFFAAVAGVRTTTRTGEATIIQTRHRIPETPLAAGQTIVYQVPGPEPLRFLEPRETETRRLHALADYGLMYVKLYEDIARYGHIATTYDYPVMVNGRYLMAPSPIPSFDNPKMHRSPHCSCSAPGARSAFTPSRRTRTSRAWASRTIHSSRSASTSPVRSAAPPASTSTRSSPTTRAARCSSAPTPTTASARLRHWQARAPSAPAPAPAPAPRRQPHERRAALA